MPKVSKSKISITPMLVNLSWELNVKRGINEIIPAINLKMKIQEDSGVNLATFLSPAWAMQWDWEMFGGFLFFVLSMAEEVFW